MSTLPSGSFSPKLPTSGPVLLGKKGKVNVKRQGRPAQRMKARGEEWMFVCVCRVSETGTDALMQRILDS